MQDTDAMPKLLEGFLADATGRSVTVHGYEQMTGGYSRAMARADVTWDDGSTDSLVLRGDPPAGQAMIETDRAVEWAVLSALQAGGEVSMPRPRWYDGTGDVFGTKVIVLDFCPGDSLQATLDATGDDLSQHLMDLATTMGKLHNVDPGTLAGTVEVPASWERHMDGLIGQFRTIEADCHEAEPVLRYVGGYLDANRPPPIDLRIVHGDFQPANIMVGADGEHLLIDWELCHIGDPREELGYYINYASATGPNLYATDPEAFLSCYREVTGFSEEAVNQATIGYFCALASTKLWGQIHAGAGAMAAGENAGIMTTYTLSALTIGRQNFLASCH